MRGSILALSASIFILAGVVLVLSIPMLLGRVAPNGIYGFRTAKTISDPTIWYAANATIGRISIIICSLMILLGAGYLILERLNKPNHQTMVIIGLSIEVVPMVILAIIVFLYNRSL